MPTLDPLTNQRALFVFESKENAIIELEKLKRINKSAWILTN